MDSVFYTSYLSEHILDNDNNAVTDRESSSTYAKKICSNGKTIYYILLNNNTVFNPFEIYGNRKHKSLFANNGYKYIKVSKYVFDMYIKFLNSQNLSLLHNVKREILI